MGFGTDALVHVYFNKTTFDTKNSVEIYIEEREEEVKRLKQELHGLVFMTEPKKFCPEDYDPEAWLESRYREIMEELEESAYLLDMARLVLAGWEYSHHENGCALVDDPKIDMETLQRINGDYIPACFPDGSNAYPDCETGTSLYNRFTGKEE